MPDKSLSIRMVNALVHGQKAVKKEAKAQADFLRGAGGFDQRRKRIFSEAHVDGTKPADPSGHS